jgi:hypothetical protein
MKFEQVFGLQFQLFYPLDFQLKIALLQLAQPTMMKLMMEGEEEKKRKRILQAAEDLAGIQKPFVRCNLADPAPREGYTHRDGEKGIGYYLNGLVKKKTAEEATYVTTCADGPLAMTLGEAQMLQTMQLPTIALPGATVKQIIQAAIAATKPVALDVVQEENEESEAKEEVKEEC